MSELSDDLSRAREHVKLSWNEDREARLRRGIERRRRRARATRWGALALVIVGCAALYGVMRVPEATRVEGQPPLARAQTEEPSTIEAVDPRVEPDDDDVGPSVSSDGADLEEAAVATTSAADPAPAVAVRRASPKATDWRTLVAAGQHHEAYELLVSSGVRVAPHDPVALMEAADAARLSGHPKAATGYLEAVLARHRKSPLAPLAAFTLGRLLLDRLGQPREAAEAFARALELSPKGSLSEDALAREVEAWSKAGEAALARERAETYLRRYPDGRRTRAVKLYGGLE